MKKLFIILIAACSMCFASCNTMKHTRGELYPKMYEEKPVTLLVMPPINNSNNVVKLTNFNSFNSLGNWHRLTNT